jgi:very-short-patch-repair endonuclease
MAMKKRSRWRASTEQIREAARAMRTHMTPAEMALWTAIRRGGLDGISFRRQHALGRFVLDFYAPRHKLAIEVDGAVHETQQERDAERTEALAERGIRVIRFSNVDVEANVQHVLERIRWEVRLQTDGEPEL